MHRERRNDRGHVGRAGGAAVSDEEIQALTAAYNREVENRAAQDRLGAARVMSRTVADLRVERALEALTAAVLARGVK